MWGETAYIPAIMGASGVTEEQAKTCLYYAVATYLIPDTVSKMPILAIIGPPGTGKSALLSQIKRMVNEPKSVLAESKATLRDEIADTVTVLIDEGDKVDENLLIKRSEKKASKISYKSRGFTGAWVTTEANLFGATIIARRTPFNDGALRSRSIVIRTEFRDGDFKLTKLPEVRAKLSAKAEGVTVNPNETKNRVKDTWTLLQAIAESIGDSSWLDYSDNEIEKSIGLLKGSHGYEPEVALLRVLKEKMTSEDLPFSEIRDELKNVFEITLRNQVIQEMCQQLGFRVVNPDGYPTLKSNLKLLDKLLIKETRRSNK